MTLIVLALAAAGALLAGPSGAATLPFDASCSVVYDNDDHRDTYTDEYLMALAHGGAIQLRGIITTYAADQEEYQLFVSGRKDVVRIARESGMKHIPDPVAGTSHRLARPTSGRVADTKPLDLPASQLILKWARRATPSKPLVVVAGGQLTTIADALLLDPSIADRVIISAIMGAEDRTYNCGLDPWAWTIVLTKLRCFCVQDITTPGDPRSAAFQSPPLVPKSRIRAELPQAVPFFRWMYEKHHPKFPLPNPEADWDGLPAVALVAPSVFTEVRRMRAIGVRPNGDPEVVLDPKGPIYVAVRADQQAATKEFWRAMRTLRRSLPPLGVSKQEG